MKLIIKILIVIIIVAIMCNALIYWLQVEIGQISRLSFLFNFVGIVLGFALTIYTFVVSMIDKLKDSYSQRLINDPNRTALVLAFDGRAKMLCTEMMENIIFIFYSLVIVSGLYLVKQFGFSPIPLFCDFSLSFDMFLQSTKLAIFVLNLYAIFDLIMALFRLSEHYR